MRSAHPRAAAAAVVSATLFFLSNGASAQAPYVESEATSTTNSATLQDKAVLTFTAPSVGSYLFVATALHSSSNTNATLNEYAQVQATLDGVTVNRSRQFATSVGNWTQFASHHVASLTAGPHTFKIQYRTESTAATPSTTSIRNARIIAIPLASGSFNNAQGVGVATTSSSTTFATSRSAAFTAAVGDEWLLLASADAGEQGTGASVEARLTLNGADAGTMQYRPPRYSSSIGAMHRSYAVARVVTATQASNTIALQYRTTSTSTTANFRSGQVTAVRLASLLPIGATRGYAESEPATATTSTAFVPKVSAGVTPNTALNYLVIGAALVRNESATADVTSRLVLDGTAQGDTVFRPTNSSSTANYVPLSSACAALPSIRAHTPRPWT